MNSQAKKRSAFVRRLSGIFLSAALMATGMAGLTPLAASAAQTTVNLDDYGLMDTVQEGVILHTWQWSFNNIKNNMQAIAEAGYSSIQTSVIQQAKESTLSADNSVWWVYYQPANFTIDNTGNSALGTKAEFAAMCEEAHKYGIHVIVDVVANHLGNEEGYDISSAVPADIREDPTCWHTDGFTDINYKNRYSITHGSMGGLPDLNSESTKVQNYVIDYLKECIDCGADGFRFDAAKHISVPDEGSEYTFWSNVIPAAKNYYTSKGYFGSLYVYGEILGGTGGPSISSYTKYMAVTDNSTGNGIRNCVAGGNAAGAATSNYNAGAGAANSVLWAESHDTYSNMEQESTNVSVSNINKTWALVGSRNKATALYFARTAGFRTGAIGEIGSTACFNPEVAAVNKFHNFFNGESEYLSSSGSSAYHERGTTGVVLVNCGGNSATVSVTAHAMENGVYTDQVSGNTFTVANGTISGKIGSTGIAVVYNPDEARGSVAASPSNLSFTSDTLNVTLYADQVTNATYTTSEGASGTYTNGQVITIGANASYGTTITVTLTGTKTDDTTATATYTYKKKDPASSTIIYFDNTTYQWSDVYAYIYAESTAEPGNTNDQNIYFTNNRSWGTIRAYFFNSQTDTGVGAAWPGTAMTYVEDNEQGQKIYKITPPSGADSVVFNDGSSKTQDIVFTRGYGYYLKGSASTSTGWVTGSWAYGATETETLQNGEWPGLPMTYNSSLGLYVYEVEDSLKNGFVIFNDGIASTDNRYPGHQETGLSINSTNMIFGADYSWSEYEDAPQALTNTSSLASDVITLGNALTVNCSAVGGTAPYTFAVYYKQNNATAWTTAQGFSSAATASIKPTKTGGYDVCIKAKDSTGAIAKSYPIFNVDGSGVFTCTPSLSASSIALGSSATVTCSATSGTAPYTFAVYTKKSTDTAWSTVQNFASTTSVKLTPSKAGSYEVCVKAKDAAGTIAKAHLTLTVTSSGALTCTPALSVTSITPGKSATVNCDANGGSSSYTFAVYYKEASASKWTTAQNFSSKTAVKVAPSAVGSYSICVKAKDSSGTIAKAYLTLTVASALNNTSTLDSSLIDYDSNAVVRCSAEGGTGGYTYAVYCKEDSASAWTTVQSFSSTNVVTFKPGDIGTYSVCVKVKDSSGTIAKTYLPLNVGVVYIAVQ